MGDTSPAARDDDQGEYVARTSGKMRLAAAGMVLLLATTAMACSSTNSASSTTATAAGGGGSGGSSKIPASASSDHTGVTANSVTVGNVSTLSLGGLFKGAVVGTQAYFDFVNSTGGVNGRKLTVDSADDNFSGATNKQATQNAITNDFSMVGSFSLEDSYGGALLAANPGVPDVSNVLDKATSKLSNVYSPVPLNGGWQEGPLQYFKKKFPNDINASAALVGDLPSAVNAWSGEKYVLQKVGYKVVYEKTYGVAQANFDQNVVAMKNAGVKMLFVDSMAESYASGLLKSLTTQNFHPIVILGAATYTNKLVADSGGASAVNGDYLQQSTALYLGQDASSDPAVASFLHWVNVASPGFTPDLFTLYGWLSAQVFVQALQNAGTNPSRGSLLTQLSKISTFDGQHIIGPNDVAAKTPGNCYLIGQVVNGNWQRLDDPPVSGPNHGFRCDYSYVTPPKA
jgi:branched-chain amino acid transport system substrate-binding protein